MTLRSPGELMTEGLYVSFLEYWKKNVWDLVHASVSMMGLVLGDLHFIALLYSMTLRSPLEIWSAGSGSWVIMSGS